MFPESCRDSMLDDKVTYSTVVRIAGSWTPYGNAILTLMKFYGWTRAVLVSDSVDSAPCTLGSTAVVNAAKKAGSAVNITQITMDSSPTDQQLDAYLQQIRGQARSEYLQKYSIQLLN
jgi:Receptor family ligand binding region